MALHAGGRALEGCDIARGVAIRGAAAIAIWTIGHGTRTTDELAALLREGGVAALIDVRRYPGSRRHPHMGRDALALDLPARGLRYDWRGDALGGRRKPTVPSPNVGWRDPSFRAYADYMATPPFQGALDRLIEDERAGIRQALMCAETLWWRCHRRLIADALVARGVEVVHLIERGQHAPHRLTDFARVDERGFLVYDRIDFEQELPLEPA